MNEKKLPQDISEYKPNENMTYQDENSVLYFTIYALVNMKHKTLPVCYSSGAYLTANMDIIRNTIKIFLKTTYASAQSIRILTKQEFENYLFQHPEIQPEQILNNKKFISPS